MKITDKHAFFFTEKDIFSNFYPCTIKAYKQNFASSEHYFMYEKAMFFKDYETAQKIVTAPTPFAAKKLGREVKNFNKEVWDRECVKYMKRVCFDKFVQNQHLQTAFKEAKGRTIVEASPHDKLWGIGLGMDDPAAEIEAQWLGKNLLGQALMRVWQLIEEYNTVLVEPECPPDPQESVPAPYQKKPRVSMADSLSSSAFRAPEAKKYTPVQEKLVGDEPSQTPLGSNSHSNSLNPRSDDLPKKSFSFSFNGTQK